MCVNARWNLQDMQLAVSKWMRLSRITRGRRKFTTQRKSRKQECFLFAVCAPLFTHNHKQTESFACL